ncbi:PAS domain S-box protein [Dictyobacter aurantiacus]|uniref:histidine kinase n=1 Tax=Dictyobacter aurantiacus TaxID=1936993 RepID=A0A401ZKR5_9CHLR|nr:PAS domain S-box protein [Dictyobacter aurantiacus]GCE07410.1 hypothetical protein KDAU_47390 [Dictyobacter aurantiacus]
MDNESSSSIRSHDEEATGDQGKPLSSLAQSVWDILWLLSPDGRMQEAGHWSAFTGQSEAEAATFGWLNALHPDDRAPFEIWLRTALRYGVRDEIECRLQKAHAAHRLVRLQLFPQIAEDRSSVTSWLVCGVDLSQVQQHRVFGAEHYRLAMESGGMGLWDWDLVRNQLVWSAECKALFGLAPSTQVSYPFMLQLLHPADRDTVNQAVMQTLEQQTEFNMVFRTIWPRDGSVHWMTSRGRGLYDMEGKPLRFIGVIYDITDQKHAQEQNEATLYQASQLIETLPDPFVHLDRNWTYTYVNNAVEKLIGKPREQILGRTMFDLYPESAQQDFVVQYRKAMETRQPVVFKAYYPSGQRWYETRVYPDNAGGISVYSNNITEQKQVEEALQATETNFRSLIESNLIGIVHVRLDGTILEANQAFLSLIGYTQNDVASGTLNWRTFTPPNELQSSLQAIEDLKRAGSYKPFEKRYLTRSGKLVTVLIAGVMLDNHKDEYISYIVDLTAQKELEQQKDAFIGVVSHELRTPLTAIKGNIQLVRRQLRSITNNQHLSPDKANKIIATAEERIERALHQIEMQNRLINDLLDVSRIAANKLELAPQLCDLKQLTIASVEDVRATAAMRAIHLRLPDQESILVLADPDRIGQVISNYLTNAIKYSDPKEPVTVGIELKSNRVRVWVEDHGPGLNEEAQKRIWDRFYQAKGVQVRSGSGAGLGLGLHICHTLIKRHGGDLGVNSILGQGSTFWFALPLEM